jgi:HSP20 family protein
VTHLAAERAFSASGSSFFHFYGHASTLCGDARSHRFGETFQSLALGEAFLKEEYAMNLPSRVPVRRNGQPSVWRDPGLGGLQREIDRIFDTFTGGLLSGAASVAFPVVDVSETNKEIRIECELPGMEERDVELSLADNILTIRGEKRAEREEKDDKFAFTERSYGTFSRSIELPAHVDPSQVKAKMNKGVLKITAPKIEAPNARRIEIRPEA